MSTITIILIIIGAVILLVLFYIIGTRNSFIGLKNNVENEWSQIDIQLKKRYDLIPNLVETVKGYAKHEKETLNSVINARNAYANATTQEGQIKASNDLSNAISKLFALSESYPDLKANTNFIDLQDTLKEIEEKIAYSRSFYNDSVLKYNNKVEMFPSNIIASLFHFNKKTFFEIIEEQRENVQVKF